MKTVKFLSLVIFITVTAIAVKSIVPAFVQQKTIHDLVSVNDDYTKLWVKADSLVAKGLTRSAIEVVQVIYTKAKNENNTGNFVKAVTYKLRL